MPSGIYDRTKSKPNSGLFKKGQKCFYVFKGQHLTEEHKQRISQSLKGKKFRIYGKISSEHYAKLLEGKKKYIEIYKMNNIFKKVCKICKKEFNVKTGQINKKRGKFCSRKCYAVWQSKFLVGKLSNNFKHGLSKDRQFHNKLNQKYYHNNKDFRLKVLAYGHFRRTHGGRLTTKTIQMVYEDNIKKYGSLTCELCNKTIEFGQDSLEHKTPISRGGTNEYSNLAVAHRLCNSKKRTKTMEEWKNLCGKKI